MSVQNEKDLSEVKVSITTQEEPVASDVGPTDALLPEPVTSPSQSSPKSTGDCLQWTRIILAILALCFYRTGGAMGFLYHLALPLVILTIFTSLLSIASFGLKFNYNNENVYAGLWSVWLLLVIMLAGHRSFVHVYTPETTIFLIISIILAVSYLLNFGFLQHQTKNLLDKLLPGHTINGNIVTDFLVKALWSPEQEPQKPDPTSQDKVYLIVLPTTPMFYHNETNFLRLFTYVFSLVVASLTLNPYRGVPVLAVFEIILTSILTLQLFVHPLYKRNPRAIFTFCSELLMLLFLFISLIILLGYFEYTITLILLIMFWVLCIRKSIMKAMARDASYLEWFKVSTRDLDD
ncbi:hypothetical protein MP638_001277 [Amoeboaphelidium occidentale]|nr:hypothetical protein MP638_001277 [Amoeboaphelidium occidentale]